MGMFDRVYASCPCCRNAIELQSKSGKCTLASYTNNSVPLDVAAGLIHDDVWCDRCGNKFKVSCNVGRVRLDLIPEKYYIEDD